MNQADKTTRSVEWSLVSEDFDGCSDDSVLRLSDDGKRVFAECNGALGTWWDFDGVPTFNPEYVEPEYPVCSDDHHSVNEACLTYFGVGVKKTA